MGTRAAARALDDVNVQTCVDDGLGAPARARRAFGESMAGRRVDPRVVEEAGIVLGELVTNAVQHADPLPDDQVQVAWTLRTGVVEVAVTDAGSDTSPVPVRHHLLADTGRGLRIVRALAHEWGVVDGRRERTVWAALGGPSRRRTR